MAQSTASPIYQDTPYYYNNGEELNFRIESPQGTVIYKGTASTRPDGSPPVIYMNRILEPYLALQDINPTVTGLTTHPDTLRRFWLYNDDNDVLLQVYYFLRSYEGDWPFGPTKILSDPITPHISKDMTMPFTVVLHQEDTYDPIEIEPSYIPIFPPAYDGFLWSMTFDNWYQMIICDGIWVEPGFSGRVYFYYATTTLPTYYKPELEGLPKELVEERWATLDRNIVVPFTEEGIEKILHWDREYNRLWVDILPNEETRKTAFFVNLYVTEQMLATANTNFSSSTFWKDIYGDGFLGGVGVRIDHY